MSESTQPRRTPLHDLHVELGARLIDFAGWDMPVWYDGAVEEHHAVRRAAGLFDLSHMAELFVTGAGAEAALNWALLIDTSTMPVGRARYSMICTEDGGIIDDLIVYRLDDHEFMVVANASNGAVVAAALRDRCADFDAEVDDRTESYSLVAIQGPKAEQIAREVVSPELVDLRYYRVAQLDGLLAARTGYTGEDGFEFFVPASDGIGLWQRLAQAGSAHGVVPVGLAARDTLRLEAGMPLYGNELGLDTTPFDVGSARLVKPKEAGHVGADALAAAAEQPHQSLIGLEISGRRPARTGYDVHGADGSKIGTVTSGTLSPTLEKLIAIARVATAREIGSTVHVDVRGTMTEAIVVELPFYKRAR